MSVFTVDQIQKFEALLVVLEQDWAKVKPVLTGLESYLKLDGTAFGVAANFVFDGVDQFVQLAGQFTAAGADKKALVVKYANELFNLAVTALVPALYKGPVVMVEPIFDSLLDAAIELAYRKLVAATPAPATH